jgi:Flp pilus assembly protein TadG
MIVNTKQLIQIQVSPRVARRRWVALLKPLAREQGASIVEVALLLPVLVLLLLGAIDFGMAYYLDIEIGNAAYAGALYGSQNNTDTTGMQNAAVKDAANVKNMTATAIYGCECSDGTNQVPSCTTQPAGCSVNPVNYVQVTTSATYRTLFPWPGIPSTFPMQGLAKLRAGL